ncbi:MAG TPA: TIGR01620 family protein [Beijerinckiaceae bacterium]|jgi:putative membrane protein|nr:TIGR01620 family protein [Beijerinckiaceae bacterium]
MSDSKVRPRAFRLDDGKVVDEVDAQDNTNSGRIIVDEVPDPFAADAEAAATGEEALVETAQKNGIVARSGMSWSGLFWSAIGGLVSLSVGLWIDQLVQSLFEHVPALAWVAALLATLAALALAILAGREFAAVLRQRHIAKLHIAFAAARAQDDRDAARKLTRELSALYIHRPGTARARAELTKLSGEIVDGRDLIDIAERTLILTLDASAQREIAAAAKRVSLVTALSPRALLDVIFVAAQAVRLVRRIAEIYGGRPGFLGFIRIARSVVTHLAITGGVAVGDSLVQQMVGHGIAARLSARLGEGVLNGLLTARVGLSAMAVCRPMPFSIAKPPSVGDVAPFLFNKE